MRDRYDDSIKTDLAALQHDLGLGPSSTPSLPVVASPQEAVPVTVDVGGQDFTVYVPPEGRRTFRQRFKELARREKRRAADAGNAANTSQLLGGSIGGALATSGVIALATASGPLALAAVVATGVGSLIAAGGLMAGHWMNQRKFSHEELMERYLDLAEELK